jgi:hypothetical protein
MSPANAEPAVKPIVVNRVEQSSRFENFMYTSHSFMVGIEPVILAGGNRAMRNGLAREVASCRR